MDTLSQVGAVMHTMGSTSNQLRDVQTFRTGGETMMRTTRRRDLAGREARRLYEVSRDCYAPALAAFASEWLGELARRPDGVAVCLGRDGLASFLAARTLLRVHPRRFRDVRAHRVRLAYVSRPLARGAAADARQAVLLDRYLRGRGVVAGSPLILVDIGIHGSIQDCLQRIYPTRAMDGRYLVLRRRDGDPNGARKLGFLADLDVMPRCPLEIGQSWPPQPDWKLGGRLRRGDSLFLRRRSVHVLEDLWNGVGGAVEGFEATAFEGERGAVAVRRRRAEPLLSLPTEPIIVPAERAAIKRAALRGVVDGVAERGRRLESDAAGASEATRALAAWLAGLDDPAGRAEEDARILRALVRRGRQGRRRGEDGDADDMDAADDIDAADGDDA